MKRLDLARYDRMALAIMRSLNRDGIPLSVTAGDTVRGASSRFARGSRAVDWRSWWATPKADQALTLHHQRAVLAWLSVKAWLIWLDEAIAAPVERLADRVEAMNARIRSAPTPETAGGAET